MPKVKSTVRKLITTVNENKVAVDAAFKMHGTTPEGAMVFEVRDMGGGVFEPAPGSETVLTRQDVGKWVFKLRLNKVGKYIFTTVGEEPVADVEDTFSEDSSATRVPV